MAGEDDDLDGTVKLAKTLEHIDAAHAGHGQIDDQAAGLVGFDEVEEVFAASVGACVDAVRCKGEADRVTDFVVIDDPDGNLRLILLFGTVSNGHISINIA